MNAVHEAAETLTPRVIEIYLAPSAGAPPAAVEEATAVAGRGLEGDRYAADLGTFSKPVQPGREVTLIAQEALEAFARESGVRLPPGANRRNVVTLDVDLDALVGRRFQVGEAVLVGVEPCEPCRHLATLTGAPVLPGLVHRGGLRADVVRGGRIRVGDRVEAID